MIKTLNENNIPTRKMIAILSSLRGGVTANPYDKKVVANYRTKINRDVSGTEVCGCTPCHREPNFVTHIKMLYQKEYGVAIAKIKK